MPYEELTTQQKEPALALGDLAVAAAWRSQGIGLSQNPTNLTPPRPCKLATP